MYEKVFQIKQMCERFGIQPMPELSSSESEDEHQKANGFIGGLRIGITTIRAHARTTLAKCDTEVAQEDMKSRLQTATINLIRSERMLMETSKIVAGIVDELDDFTEDLDNEAEKLGTNLMPKLPSPEKLLFTKEKLSGILDDRMGLFKDTLTRASLETNPQYVLLQEQIVLAEGDFDRKQGKIVAYGGSDIETNGITPSSAPIQYEDETDDEEVLPCKDPITKKSMMNPIRNKFCNHIFEHSSINEFMDTNPGASCPGYSCMNKRPLHVEHFIKDAALVTKVRQKNLGVSSCIGSGASRIRKF